MSLLQLIDELANPHNEWKELWSNASNQALSRYQKQLVVTPRVDMYPVQGGVELKADLPGIAREDVKLSVEQNMLTLKGQRKSAVDLKDDQYHYAERQFGEFSRKFRLPYHADPSTVTATFDNGVLTISVPQPESTKAGEITIT